MMKVRLATRGCASISLHRTILGVLSLVGLSLCVFADAQSQKIIGYYPSWKWKTSGCLMSVDKIPYQKLDIINYAFFYPLPDGRIVGRDTIGDSRLLKKKTALTLKANTTADAGTDLISRAHTAGVKVILSLGGWEDSYNFSAVASLPLLRSTCAQSCVDLVREYGFDGIDVDWEYPGYVAHNGKPEDRQNFTSLLQAIRDSLDAYGEKIGKHLFLTAALPATTAALKTYEIEKIAPLLDMLNIMTYDFNGPWDALSGHNAPLYPPRADDSLRNLDAAFRLYTKDLKLPPEKINLGVPFYGQTYSNCLSLYAAHSGSDTLHFSSQGAFYYSIREQVSSVRRRWDEAAKVPYLVIPEWKTIISYDDEESVRWKAHYVKEHMGCGLIIWEITGDLMSDSTTPLLDVIVSQFHGSIKNQH